MFLGINMANLALEMSNLTRIMLKVSLIFNTAIILDSPRRVHALGAKATYICTDTTLNVVGMQWLINGTQLENLNLSNVNARFSRGVGRLEVSRIPLEYNDTSIQCIANFGDRNELSNILTLLVQG